MEHFIPDYYNAFSCIASACPDSCCKEWEVDVDDAAAAYYRALPGALGDRLRQVLQDTENGSCMTITDGRCPMWQNDGLCRIHAELGHDALCQTCREYPRIKHEYDGYTELGLELSCPEAARLILSSSQTGTTTHTPGDDPSWEFSVLKKGRDDLLTFWETAQRPIPQMLAATLLFSYDLQEALDGGAEAEFSPDFGTLPLQTVTVQPLVEFMGKLEILTPEWAAFLRNPSPAVWHPEIRNLAIYAIRRWWLQAVSDLDVVCRAKLILVMCLLVAHFPGNPLRAGQLMSKELENNLENIVAILDNAYSSPALTDAYLLSLLLEDKNRFSS